jgi:hypothetical protein
MLFAKVKKREQQEREKKYTTFKIFKTADYMRKAKLLGPKIQMSEAD